MLLLRGTGDMLVVSEVLFGTDRKFTKGSRRLPLTWLFGRDRKFKDYPYPCSPDF